jgi:hypothetical protein
LFRRISNQEIMAEFQKGDVLYGTDREKETALHPILYLEGDMVNDFIGVMLTHSNRFKANKPLLLEHFLTHDEDRNEFDFKWDDTRFVAVRLLKPANWGPYLKNGEVTQQGIDVIEAQLPEMEALLWEHYISHKG